MEELIVLVRKEDGAHVPVYATPSSSGMDLHAHLSQPINLNPMERALVPTGLFVSIPQGYEGQVRPRSGLAVRFGITVLNSPGTIDSDYRGEIKVILVNLSSEVYTIGNGDRIAQIIFGPLARARMETVEELPVTERGEGGFGSTGL